MSRHTTRRRTLTTLAITLLATGTATACGDSDHDLPDPPAPTPATTAQPAITDLTAEEQEAVDSARAVFDDFMTTYQDILTAGEPPTDAVLGRILPLVASPFSRDVHGEIAENYQAGQRMEGHIDWTYTEVIEVDMERTAVIADQERPVPTVRLRYCVDRTEWLRVDKGTEEPVHEPGDRHPVTIEINYFDTTPIPIPEDELDPTWLIGLWEDQEGQPC